MRFPRPLPPLASNINPPPCYKCYGMLHYRDLLTAFSLTTCLRAFVPSCLRAFVPIHILLTKQTHRKSASLNPRPHLLLSRTHNPHHRPHPIPCTPRPP